MEIESFRLQSTQVQGTSLSSIPCFILIVFLGCVDTELVRDTLVSLKWPIIVSCLVVRALTSMVKTVHRQNLFVLTPAQGAITQLWAGTEKGIEERNGAVCRHYYPHTAC